MHYLKSELNERFKSGDDIFEFVKDTCLDGLWYWDLEKPEEEWMSPRFWEVFGYDPKKMPHKVSAWKDLIHPDDVVLAEANLNAHLADPNHPYDQIVRYKHGRSGKWAWVRCRGLAMRNAEGKPVRMLGAHVDVTSLKETEELLRGTVEELLVARAEAEQALQAKTIFLETMSHEIRTPMNGIMGMAQTLALQDLPLDAMTQVAVINRSARALLTLLNDVLDMAQIEAGKVSMEMEALCPLQEVREAVDVFQQMADEKGLELITMGASALSKQVIGSNRSIRQVISNLVSNAVKFAQSGRVEVRVYLEASDTPDTKVLRVSVVDQGPGVPDVEKKGIFRRFAQGSEGCPDGHKGTGLGLAIARQLCELHGGALALCDTPGGGATFDATFAVRHAEETHALALKTAPMPVGAEPLRILVVEDNEMNQMVLEAMLGHMNAKLSFASDGREGLELAQKEAFDAGFIDIRMPVMSGTDFASAWRARENKNDLPRLPLIACSANVLPHHVERYLAAGFDRHLPKPVTLEGLRSCIKWIWSQRALDHHERVAASGPVLRPLVPRGAA